MAESKLKIDVTADATKARQELQGVSSQIDGLEKVNTKAAAAFGKVSASVAAVTVAVGAAVKVSKELINTYSTQLLAETKLDAALRASGNQYSLSARRLKEYASSLQDVTRFGDEAIIEAQSLLVATKKLNEEGIERTLAASADLAEALGTDIKSAAQTLAKVLQEPTSGLDRLKQSGINFTEQEKDQIKKLTEANKLYEAQAIVLGKVEASYGGMAKAIAETDAGKLTQIQNVWGDIKENLGKGLLDTISPALDTLYQKLKDINDIVDQMVNPNKEERAILTALQTGGSLAEWSNDELSAWGNKFLLDRNARWNDNPMAANYNPYVLRNMSAQQMWETYGVDLSGAVSEYFEFEGYWDKIVEELKNRMLAEGAVNALEVASNTVAELGARGRSRTGADVDAETWLYNLVGGFDVPGIKTSQLGSNGLLPYLDPSLIGRLDPSITMAPIESVNSVASRLRAGTIADYYQTKGKNSQSYWDRMKVWYDNGAAGFVPASAEDAVLAIESVNDIAERNRIANSVAYSQEHGKNSSSYYARMENYFNEGNNQDRTGTSYVWEAPIEESYSAFEDLKSHLKDIGAYAKETFSSIASSLADVFTSQAENIRQQMESLRAAGSLTLEEEENMTKKMNELNRKAFVAKQLNAVADATTSWATGTMNIWKEYAAHPAVAGVMTALLTGTYGAQLATINAQQYTPFAKGGIVTGPTRALVGESGTEAIIPLNSNRAKNMMDGMGNGVTVNITIEGNAREEDVYYAIERAQRTGLLPRWSFG